MALEAVPAVAKEGSKAIERLTRRDVFAPTLVLVLLTVFVTFLWMFRVDWREERQAQAKFYDRMVDRMDDIHDHLLDLGAQKSERDRRLEAEARHSSNSSSNPK